jgi:hypothetical protein
VKPEHVVAVGLRLLAIYLAFSTITSLIRSGWFYVGALGSSLVILVTVLCFGIAFLLWRFALGIALRLVRWDGSVNTAPTSMTPEEVQNVAFTVLGLYFLFRAVTDGVYWLAFFGHVQTPLVFIDPQQWASIAVTIAEFVIACLLVFGADGLTLLISKVREAGRDKGLEK